MALRTLHASPPVHAERRWLWFGIIILLAGLAVAAGIYANRFGAELTTDSGVYISAGMRLARGEGVSYPNFVGPPQAMSLFPPVYPAMISLFDRMHLPLSIAIGVCNALCWGLLVAGVGLVAWRATDGCGPMAVLAAAAILTSAAIYSDEAMAMSEPLCLLFIVAGVVAIAAIESRAALRYAALAGLVVATAILTRYAALPLVAAGCAAIALTPGVGKWRKLLAMAIFVTCAMTPALAWTLFHRDPGDTPGQRTLAYHALSHAKISEAFDTVASMILPDAPWRPSSRVVVWVTVAIILSIAIGKLWLAAKGKSILRTDSVPAENGGSINAGAASRGKNTRDGSGQLVVSDFLSAVPSGVDHVHRHRHSAG